MKCFRKKVSSLLLMFTIGFVTSSMAVEDWYLYVAFHGLANPGADDVACFAPDGSAVWNNEVPNPRDGFEWIGIAHNPVYKSVIAASPNLDVIWRFDRYQGRIIDGLPNRRSELPNPVSITVGPSGDVFVGNETSDPPHGGIQRYNGIRWLPVSQFADIGSRGITFGPDGNLYACSVVGAPNSGRIFKIDGTDGTFLGDYTAHLGSQLTSPVWHEGDLYVTQPSSNTILRIADGGSTVTEFVTSGDGGLRSPHGFAFTPGGDLLVTSRGVPSGGSNAIKRFDGTTGAYIDDFAALPSTSAPMEVALEIIPQPDPANDFEVFVCTDGGDTPPNSLEVVQKIDSSGSVTRTFDDPDPTGHLRWTGIALGPDDNLYVSSLGEHNVYRWNLDGTFMDVFTAGTTHLNQSDDLTFDPEGSRLLVGCQSSAENRFGVVRFDGENGSFIDRFDGTFSVTGVAYGPASFDPSDDPIVYVTRTNGQVPAYDGTSGDFLGLFNDLADEHASNLGLFAREPKAHDGYIYVAQGARIYRFNPQPSGGMPGHLLEPEFVANGSGGMTVAHGFDWDPEGNLLVASGGSPNGIRKFHGRTGEYLGMFAELASTSWPNDLLVREITIAVPVTELSIAASNRTVEIMFDTVIGQTYDVQLEEDLPADTWTNDPVNENIQGTGSSVMRTINSGQRAQNIRVSTDVD